MDVTSDLPAIDLVEQGFSLVETAIPLVDPDLALSTIQTVANLHTELGTFAETSRLNELRGFVVPADRLLAEDRVELVTSVTSGNSARTYEVVDLPKGLGGLRLLDPLSDTLVPAPGQRSFAIPEIEGGPPTEVQLHWRDPGVRMTVVASAGWVAAHGEISFDAPAPSVATVPTGTERRYVQLRVDSDLVRRSTFVAAP